MTPALPWNGSSEAIGAAFHATEYVSGKARLLAVALRDADELLAARVSGARGSTMEAPVSLVRKGSLFALLARGCRANRRPRRGRPCRHRRDLPPGPRDGRRPGPRGRQDAGNHLEPRARGRADQPSFTINQLIGTTASFTGPIVFTTALGTLTAQVAGTFDVASGAFQATCRSLTGTGLLRAGSAEA